MVRVRESSSHKIERERLQFLMAQFSIKIIIKFGSSRILLLAHIQFYFSTERQRMLCVQTNLVLGRRNSAIIGAQKWRHYEAMQSEK